MIGFLYAASHVFCVVLGFYLCYATLAGRLLPRKTYSLAAAQKAAEANAEKYRVNREAEEPTFLEKTLRSYSIDRDSYLGPGAGSMPLPKTPPEVKKDGKQFGALPQGPAKFAAH